MRPLTDELIKGAVDFITQTVQNVIEGRTDETDALTEIEEHLAELGLTADNYMDTSYFGDRNTGVKQA